MLLHEIILIAIGLGLEIFAIVVCKGAVFSKIHKKTLFQLIAIFATWQLVTVIIGNLLVGMLHFTLSDSNESGKFLLQVLSIIIFGVIAMRMLFLAHKNEDVIESREDSIKVNNILQISAIVGLNGLVAGVGFGFMETSMIHQLIVLLSVSVLAVIIGIYVGYNYGYRPKTRGYLLGGLILLVTDVVLCIRYFN
ncbi:MAG: manganese efflux pump [Lachnospiraceae bacterium]|nr:manganese efflux pump [Lachnospiraceae bacterium]